MAATTLKLGGREFVILPKKEYAALKARSRHASGNGAKARGARKPSNQDLSDLAEIERRRRQPGKNIPWEQVKRKLGALTMAYSIEFRPAARRDLERLPHQIRRRVASKIDSLAINPRPSGCVKIVGSTNSYRIRVGDYRVVYEIYDDRLLVVVFIVCHRRESYRGL